MMRCASKPVEGAGGAAARLAREQCVVFVAALVETVRLRVEAIFPNPAMGHLAREPWLWRRRTPDAAIRGRIWASKVGEHCESKLLRFVCILALNQSKERREDCNGPVFANLQVSNDGADLSWSMCRVAAAAQPRAKDGGVNWQAMLSWDSWNPNQSLTGPLFPLPTIPHSSSSLQIPV